MKFIVNGGKKLSGDIEVGGSKNAALPILAATLLTERPCVVKNLPIIGDVQKMIDLLKNIGSKIDWLDKKSVRIVNKNIDVSKLDREIVCKIRSSILLVGPLVARFGEAVISTPGGCHIGKRPMDAHFDAFKELGCEVIYNKNKDLYKVVKTKKYHQDKIILKEFSVTATENLMMFGSLSPKLTIEIAAAEPHIKDLGEFINKLGAEIEGLGSHTIQIKKGVAKRGGEIKHIVINDYIEAGTFMVLAAATKSNIRIKDVPVNDLLLPIQKLKEFGVVMDVNDSVVNVFGSRSKLKAVQKVMVQPHPGFPADLQAPFGVLATQAKGETLIFDTLYEGRLKYLYELDKMGANIEILDQHRAIISGPTDLHGKNVESIDLRAGVTLIIAALVADGESILHNAEQIDRGYEKIDERLQKIGANIKRSE